MAAAIPIAATAASIGMQAAQPGQPGATITPQGQQPYVAPASSYGQYTSLLGDAPSSYHLLNDKAMSVAPSAATANAAAKAATSDGNAASTLSKAAKDTGSKASLSDITSGIGALASIAGGVSQILQKPIMPTIQPQGMPTAVHPGLQFNQAAQNITPLRVNQSQDYIPQGGNATAPSQGTPYDQTLMHILSQFSGVR